MICSPSNAYPNNNCVDGNDYELKITFFGDYCMGADFFVYDYNTKELMGKKHLYYERGDSTDGFHNGEEIDIKNPPVVPQNNEYVWRAKFYEKVDIANHYFPTIYSSKGTIQTNPITEVTVTDEVSETEDPKVFGITAGLDITLPCYIYWQGYGRRVITRYNKTRGLVQVGEAFESMPSAGTVLYISSVKFNSVDEIASETATIPIEKGLNIDYGTHYRSGTGSATIPNTYIKIGGSYYGITKYYPKTGLLAVDGTVLEAAFAEGTSYQIYQCFVISPYYYFTTKAVPTVTPMLEYVDGVIKCTAEISTAGNYPIKYFYWSIYAYDGSTDTLINQSEKIYSGRLEYIFREVQTNNGYGGKITIVTQDGVEVTSNISRIAIFLVSDSVDRLTAEVIQDTNAVKLTWNNLVTPDRITILRRRSDEPNKYLETIHKVDSKGMTEYIDYSCGDISDYIYTIVPTASDEVYNSVSVNISTLFNNWSIYFLDEIPYERPSTSITDVRIYHEYMYGDKQFKVNSMWQVQIQPKIDDITHNVYRKTSDPQRGKPVITYGNKDYDSFTLEFTLGYIDCPTEDYAGYDLRKFEKWKADINSGRPVMIKDSKGNVWFGAITAHSYNIGYDESLEQFYNIKIDFVQTRDMAKTRILTN